MLSWAREYPNRDPAPPLTVLLAPAPLLDERTGIPTGLQSARTLRARRTLVLALNLGTYGALTAVVARVLGAGGWTAADIGLFIAFLVGAPWTILTFWNAMLGLWLLHGVRDGLRRAAPFVGAGDGGESVHLSTAVVMTLRNEDPARALERLKIVKGSVDCTGFGGRFAYFVLSDTSDPAIAAAEERAVEAWWRETGEQGALVYRRRTDNIGFKGGNLRDFCERWGKDYDLMLPLDADSLMAGETVVRMVRIMQAHPRIGILQSLVVGLPSKSAFARVFQFGMRHGMRPHTVGAAWWTADCGPYWGHNALVRIAPFREACALPVLPGAPPLGGHILSHDQVEAVLMRRAGYEVRVLPVEGGSWEETPPTLPAFVRRDARWCQGNMQYWRLLAMPGLKLISRYQLAWAILMFLGVFAWTAMIALIPFKALDGESPSDFPGKLAIGVYLAFQLMYLAPRLAGLADIALTKGGIARYGGALRFWCGAALEIDFSCLLGAAVTLRTSAFMLGLLCGRSVPWSGQERGVAALSWRDAARGLWWVSLFGIAVAGVLGTVRPAALWWTLPLVAGYLAAIPFAVASAAPRLGALFVRCGLNGVPEDFDPPAEIRQLTGDAQPRLFGGGAPLRTEFRTRASSAPRRSRSRT